MRRKNSARFVSFVGILLASVVSAFAACSGGGNSGDDDDNGVSGQGGGGPQPFAGSAGFGFGGFGDGGGGPTQVLVVEPADVQLTATGSPVTQQFQAKLADGTPATGVSWSVGDVSVGLIGQGGVFTAKGLVAGETVVTATAGNARGTARVRVTVGIVDNPGGKVSPEDQGKLQAGGSGDATLRWLYPYDATVFPRGVGAPLVQLGGLPAGAMRLLVETAGFRYEGFFTRAANVNQIQLPEAVWQGLVASAQPGEKVKVTATTLVNGKAAGPIEETWSIAPGSLKGIVYYNSYDSRLEGVPEDGDGRPGGPAVLAIKPGQQAEPLLVGCQVCHSVSSQGNRLVTGVDWADAESPDPGDVPNNPRDSASYELKADGSAQRKYEENEGRRYAFGGLSPDGKWFLSNGVVGEDSRFIRGLQGDPKPMESKLYDTDTGAVVATTDLGVLYAMTPAFSHDGSKIAFNRVGPAPLPAPPAGGDPALEQADRSTLSVVDFDGAAATPTFGPIVNVLDASVAPVKAGEKVRAWPSFLPDTKAVVFHEGTQFDTGNSNQRVESKAFAHVRMVELATKRVVALRALNGEKADGSGTALPTYPGDAIADHSSLNYEPTVLPVPVGGYYWVFFTSRRAYGNTIAQGGLVPGGDDPFGKRVGGKESPSPRKKLWVAAIDLDYAEKLAADPNYDPSHPAFFVTGQELEAGNMRAFAALEPCRGENASCESSTECCDGRSCRQTGTTPDGQPVLQCVTPAPAECSREDDSCETASDCCDAPAGVLCINKRCARPTPVPR
jgi:hypothetical protein